MIRSGLDVFLDAPKVSGAVGLLTNVASLTRDGQTALRALQAKGVKVAALFSPEHGYYGLGAAGESMPDDQAGSVPIHSLYGTAHTPTPEMLRPLSAVLIDLQDTGTRWYTFLATLRYMLIGCAAQGVPVIVLDRPNPQGGAIVEGMLATLELFSMVAPAALPVRYGLTIGEAARLFNETILADLTVIEMVGWRRDYFFDDTGLSWRAPSPNMPHAHTALLYTGTCLIEGLTVSEGRGTPLPFEQFGAPFMQAEALTDTLNALELPGVSFSPAWFRPASSKYAGQRCEGARIHITDARRVRGFSIGLHIVETLRQLYGTQIAWAAWGSQNGFDLLAATPYIREGLEADQPVAEIIARCEEEAAAFQADSARVWLYR